jgi:hypothetical protein
MATTFLDLDSRAEDRGIPILPPGLQKVCRLLPDTVLRAPASDFQRADSRNETGR